MNTLSHSRISKDVLPTSESPANITRNICIFSSTKLLPLLKSVGVDVAAVTSGDVPMFKVVRAGVSWYPYCVVGECVDGLRIIEACSIDGDKLSFSGRVVPISP